MYSGNLKAIPSPSRWSSGTVSATTDASASATFIPMAARHRETTDAETPRASSHDGTLRVEAA